MFDTLCEGRRSFLSCCSAFNGAPLLEHVRKHRHAAVLLYGARGSGKERAFAGALVDDDDGHALDATDEAVGGEGLALSLGQAMTGAAGSHDAFEWTSRRRSSVLLAAAQDNDAATSLRVTLVEVGAGVSEPRRS